MNNSNNILNAMNSVTLFFSNLKKPYKVNRKNIYYLIHYLKQVPDFRNKHLTTYKLENILAICFIVAMKGEFTSFYNTAMYIQYKPNQFIKLGLLEKDKYPSHDTLRRIFMYLDANKLRDVFLDRMKEFLNTLVELDKTAKNKKKLISGDGKEFKGSGRTNKHSNLNVFNIMDVSQCLCLSSTPLETKDSEITEFERMITKFNINNAIITADALHCQRKLIEKISLHKGEYLITVKDNQKSLKEEINTCFQKNKFPIQTKQYNQCDYEIMILDKNYIGENFTNQKAYIRMLSHKRKKQKDYNPTYQYFITSLNNIDCIIETIDNRWCIENDLHYFKDDLLKEDECTFYNKNAVKVMATINNIVYSFYRIASAIENDPSMGVTKIKYKDEPLDLIAKVLPVLMKKNLSKLIHDNMNGTKK